MKGKERNLQTGRLFIKVHISSRSRRYYWLSITMGMESCNAVDHEAMDELGPLDRSIVTVKGKSNALLFNWSKCDALLWIGASIGYA